MVLETPDISDQQQERHSITDPDGKQIIRRHPDAWPFHISRWLFSRHRRPCGYGNGFCLARDGNELKEIILLDKGQNLTEPCFGHERDEVNARLLEASDDFL